MKCLQCGRDRHVEVQALCWWRLSLNGTDDGERMQGYEWDNDSPYFCAACGYLAISKLSKLTDGQGAAVT